MLVIFVMLPSENCSSMPVLGTTSDSAKRFCPRQVNYLNGTCLFISCSTLREFLKTGLVYQMFFYFRFTLSVCLKQINFLLTREAVFFSNGFVLIIVLTGTSNYFLVVCVSRTNIPQRKLGCDNKQDNEIIMLSSKNIYLYKPIVVIVLFCVVYDIAQCERLWLMCSNNNCP